MLSFGHCMSRGILRAANIQPPQVDPSGCSFQLVPISQHSVLLCAGFPPAAVSMDAFPHQTRPNPGCGAFSCLQAVLENSFILSTEITWGIADPFPGYHHAASQAVGPGSVSHPGFSVSHTQRRSSCVCMEEQSILGAPNVPCVSVKTELEFSFQRDELCQDLLLWT